ncbi:helix-turn-helix domain-containing protein [Psychrobacillus sp. FSL K6-1464]|uniref:helix-turn-helix domain-containing protein n=1 Tax=Psychrobacillus sp. FSL K6-1464 TaxID=2921545 RepID=UPI0030F745C6
MRYGAILQACRERAGFTQEEMAHRLNRSQSCVSKFEKDTKVPDMNTFLQWVNATNAQEVAVAFLYGMDGITMIQQLLPIIAGGFALWLTI